MRSEINGNFAVLTKPILNLWVTDFLRLWRRFVLSCRLRDKFEVRKL